MDTVVKKKKKISGRIPGDYAVQTQCTQSATGRALHVTVSWATQFMVVPALSCFLLSLSSVYFKLLSSPAAECQKLSIYCFPPATDTTGTGSYRD